MTRYVNTMIGLLLAAALLAGCAAAPTTPGTPLKSKVESAETIARDKGGNHYYEFIRAQMARRRGDLDAAVTRMNRAVAAEPESLLLQKELLYLYLQKDEDEQAAGLVDHILAEHPGDADALLVAATMRQQTGHPDQAAALLEEVIAAEPDRQKAYLVLGELYQENNHLDKAAAVYEKMTRRFSDQWEGYFLLGKVYHQQERLAAAESSFQKSLDLQPGLLSPRFALINLYQKRDGSATPITVRQGDTLYSLCREIYGSCDQQHIQAISAANPEIEDISRINPGQTIRFPHSARAGAANYTKKIIDLYQSILTDYPEEYRASLELALYYHHVGRPEEAGRILAALGEKSRQDSRIVQYVNQLYIETKKYDQAHLIVHGMRRGAPDSSALHYLAGSLYDREDRKKKAIEHFTSVGEDSSFYRHALLQAALLYEDTGQIKEADGLFETLLAEEPDNAGLLLYAGAFHERRQDFDRAIELYRHGLEIEPDNPELHYRLGVTYDQTGDKDPVIRHMKKALQINPDDASTLNYLGYTYADMGIRLDEARELIEKALELDPDNGYIIDSLGWVYFKQGDLDKAVQYLEKAVQLTPDDPILLEHLGDAYAGQNQPEKALDCYRRSLELSDEGKKPGLQKKINTITQEPDAP